MDFLVSLISTAWPTLIGGVFAVSAAHWLAVKFIRLSYHVIRNGVVSFLCGIFSFLPLSVLFFTTISSIILGVITSGPEAYVYMLGGAFALPVVGVFAVIGVFFFTKEIQKAKTKFEQSSLPTWWEICLFSFLVLFFLLVTFFSSIFLFL